MKRDYIEKNIIGTLLNGELKKLPEVLNVLSFDDFVPYRKHLELAYTAWKEKKDPYIVFRDGGIQSSELIEIQEAVPAISYLTTYCIELKELNTIEKVKKILAQKVPTENIGEFIADTQQKLVSLSVDSNEKTDIEDVVQEFTENQRLYEEKRKNGQELLGISCGFSKLDNLIDGLRPGHLWVLGGYTSLGKTFGALNIAASLIKEQKRVIIYSLEMSRIDILARLIGILIEGNSRAIAKGFSDQAKVNEALELIKKSNLTIVAERRELSQITLSMHEQTLKKPVDLFIVDYIQLVKVKGSRSDYEQAKEAAIELQDALKRFNVPGIALSQVNNDAAKAGEQMVMGFKGAGDIAAAADFAIELVSGEESTIDLKTKLHKGEPVKIKWQVKKNRHGSVGYVLMEFDGKTGISREVDENKY